MHKPFPSPLLTSLLSEFQDPEPPPSYHKTWPFFSPPFNRGRQSFSFLQLLGIFLCTSRKQLGFIPFIFTSKFVFPFWHGTLEEPLFFLAHLSPHDSVPPPSRSSSRSRENTFLGGLSVDSFPFVVTYPFSSFFSSLLPKNQIFLPSSPPLPRLALCFFVM